MTSCLYHEDRHTSMKLYDKNFYCFSCGKSGDVIELISKYTNMKPYETAKHILGESKITFAPQEKKEYKRDEFTEQEKATIKILEEYQIELLELVSVNMPTEFGEITDDYILCMNEVPKVEYYLDEMVLGNSEQRKQFMTDYWKEFDEIEMKLYALKRRK